MEAVIEIIEEGVKKFGGEIVGGILFAFALWIFPGLRKLFNKDSGHKNAEEERLKEALRQAEAQKTEEEKRRAEIERQLEEQRQEQERLKAEIQHKDDVKLQYELGKKLFDAFDYEKAEPFLCTAAEYGHAEAQYRLGCMYEHGGFHFAKNPQEARKWYQRAAGQGNSNAKNALKRLK